MTKLGIACLAAAWACAAQEYKLGADSQRQPGVPAGKVTEYTWEHSKVYPGTTRKYWVYVPAQYDGSKAACVMVFLDGGGFQNPAGAWRVPIVFDNLIHRHEMPVTIAIFIDPGVMGGRYNRSYEYDGLGPRYARFLLEEILPEAAKQYKVSSDPNDRAIAGSSSGGIAAFTAAWERPDAFHRVMSFVGSYTNLRGGDVYAGLIRKMEPKPLRVFLQDGTNDQNIYSGSWYLANQSVAKSLEYAGYDVKFTVGTEGHNAKHGGAILPDALRWLWRDYPQPITASKGGGERQYITEILDPAHDWEMVGEGYKDALGPAADRDGNLYFCDAGSSKIYKVGADGKPAVFREDTGGARSLMFDGEGRLYAVERGRKRVVRYGPDGATVLASGQDPIDLAVTSKGVVYFSDATNAPASGRLWAIEPGRAARMVWEDGLLAPVGVRVMPDESLLVVADHVGRPTWSFRIAPGGGLADAEPFYHLELPDEPYGPGPLRPGADGLTFDTTGHVYIATSIGIQICDQPGRVVGIIRPPGAERVTAVVFGGKDFQTLYATAGTRVWKRQLRRQGVAPGQVVKLPRPRL